MSQENRAIVLRFFELLEREQSIPEELVDTNLTYHVSGSSPLNLEATRQRMAGFSAAFSGIRHSVEDLVAEGDRVAFRSRLEMTHTGEYMGVAGSGEPVSVVEMGFMRIALGKIVEMWGLLDTADLKHQTGAN